MKKTFIPTIVLVILLLLILPAHASIISVSGPASSAGASASVITAPAFVTDTMGVNQAQQGFNEAQNVLTSVAFATDSGGSIAAGTRVNSHMIFMNQPDSVPGKLSHSGVTWTFDGIILGVMSDKKGNLESASTSELGNAATSYDASFFARGLEGNDSYTVSGNSITVDMMATQPGDWIRVVTAAPSTAVTSPGTLLLISLGFLGIVANRSRFNKWPKNFLV